MYSTLSLPRTGANRKRWKNGGRHGLNFATPSLPKKAWTAASTIAALPVRAVEQIPTQHEGPTVRAMEAKGIRTNKGDLNRVIRKTNALLRETKEKITALIGWIRDVKAELAKPQPPMLNDLLALHCANRNKGAYSNKAKNANLQRYAEAFSFLQSKNLYTVDDLETTLHTMQNKIDTLKNSASAKQAHIKELNELLRMVDYYKSGKPAADKLKSIRFEKSDRNTKRDTITSCGRSTWQSAR